MELSFVIMILLSGAAVLMGLGAIYFLVYRHYINQVLHNPAQKHRKMVPPYKMLPVLLVVGIGSLVVMGLTNQSGFSTAAAIEADVRRSADVGVDWNVEIAMEERLAAVIAYDQNKQEHRFAVYEERGKLGTRYVFRYGGSAVSIERSVRVFRFEGSMALVSMNALGVCVIETASGERYEIDPNSPFVVVAADGDFHAYDENGNMIVLTQDPWYEQTG